jgi:branched-chain amino acid transport system permease protein
VFDFLISSLTFGAIFALMALGLNLQAGLAGLLNFGHIAFAGIGAYGTGIAVHAGWHPALGAGWASN